MFMRFHEAEKHLDSKVSADWYADGTGLSRKLYYRLPANAILRLPEVEVFAFENARKENGCWVVSGGSRNEGSTLAAATVVTATYTLTPHAKGTKVLCSVSYSFSLNSIPWVLRRAVESFMHSEVLNGHTRFLQTSEKHERAGYTPWPQTAAVAQYLSMLEGVSMTKSFASSGADGSRAHANDSFYTPLTTPNTTPGDLEDVPPIDSSPWTSRGNASFESPPQHRVIDFGEHASPAGRDNRPQLRVPQVPPPESAPLTAQNLREVECEKPLGMGFFSTVFFFWPPCGSQGRGRN